MQITVVEHPLIKHKLTRMRSVETDSREFRELLREISMLLMSEVTRDIAVKEINVTTPLCETVGYELAQDVVIVPILRAGLGFVDGALNLVPNARVGHIGLKRDEETLEPIEYYCKLPEGEDVAVILVDPMLATGGSAVAAVDMLKARGYDNIRMMCLVAAPEGVQVMNEAHPDVIIYTASLDEKLNEKGYIVPGLGDAGDRIFGTC